MATEKRNQFGATPVLFTHYGENWIRGSERCLLDLLAHLNRSLYEPIVWCNSEIMAKEIRTLGITVYQSEFPILLGWLKPRFNIFGYLGLLKKAQKIINKHNIGMLHSNSAAPTQWLVPIARFNKIPLLTHLHSPYPLRDRVTLGVHQASKVVAVSDLILNLLHSDGLPKHKTQVISNGIDTIRLAKQPLIDLRAELNIPREQALFVSTGSLIHRKGMDRLIDSISRLKIRGLIANLVIIGEGEERKNLESQIERLALQDQIHLIGERDNIVGILRSNVDLFLSGARQEAFGLALAEAGVAGIPVVAPVVGGIPHVIKHDDTGMLYRNDCPEKIDDIILDLMHDPLRRQTLGKNGRHRVLEIFSISAYIKQFEKCYSEMINDPDMYPGWFDQWYGLPAIKQCLRYLVGKPKKDYIDNVTGVGYEDLPAELRH